MWRRKKSSVKPEQWCFVCYWFDGKSTDSLSVFVHDQLLFLSSCQILYKFQYFQAQSLILISKLKKHHVYIIYTPSPPNYVYNTHVHIFQFCWYHHQNSMLGNILVPARVKSSPPINLCKLKLKFERREANIFLNPENIQKGHAEFCLNTNNNSEQQSHQQIKCESPTRLTGSP